MTIERQIAKRIERDRKIEAANEVMAQIEFRRAETARLQKLTAEVPRSSFIVHVRQEEPR